MFIEVAHFLEAVCVVHVLHQKLICNPRIVAFKLNFDGTVKRRLLIAPVQAGLTPTATTSQAGPPPMHTVRAQVCTAGPIAAPPMSRHSTHCWTMRFHRPSVI